MEGIVELTFGIVIIILFMLQDLRMQRLEHRVRLLEIQRETDSHEANGVTATSRLLTTTSTSVTCSPCPPMACGDCDVRGMPTWTFPLGLRLRTRCVSGAGPCTTSCPRSTPTAAPSR